MGKKNDYDRFARAYSNDAEHNAFNAFYERPESLRLMGDVAGLKVKRFPAEDKLLSTQPQFLFFAAHRR